MTEICIMAQERVNYICRIMIYFCTHIIFSHIAKCVKTCTVQKSLHLQYLINDRGCALTPSEADLNFDFNFDYGSNDREDGRVGFVGPDFPGLEGHVDVCILNESHGSEVAGLEGQNAVLCPRLNVQKLFQLCGDCEWSLSKRISCQISRKSIKHQKSFSKWFSILKI